MWRYYARAVADERIYLSPPDMSEAERTYLLEAFDSNWIAPVGPDLNAFEGTLGQLTGRAHVAALSSGTAGLHLALLLADVTPGDEVLVSTFTFVATANAVLQCGATPVFVDSSAADWNIDPDLVAQELAERAKHGRLPAAVVAVDLYGQCADYDRLEPDLCRVRGSTDCRFGRIARCLSGRKARWVARAAGDAVVQRQQDHHYRRRGSVGR